MKTPEFKLIFSQFLLDSRKLFSTAKSCERALQITIAPKVFSQMTTIRRKCKFPIREKKTKLCLDSHFFFIPPKSFSEIKKEKRKIKGKKEKTHFAAPAKIFNWPIRLLLVSIILKFLWNKANTILIISNAWSIYIHEREIEQLPEQKRRVRPREQRNKKRRRGSGKENGDPSWHEGLRANPWYWIPTSAVWTVNGSKTQIQRNPDQEIEILDLLRSTWSLRRNYSKI